MSIVSEAFTMFSKAALAISAVPAPLQQLLAEEALESHDS